MDVCERVERGLRTMGYDSFPDFPELEAYNKERKLQECVELKHSAKQPTERKVAAKPPSQPRKGRKGLVPPPPKSGQPTAAPTAASGKPLVVPTSEGTVVPLASITEQLIQGVIVPTLQAHKDQLYDAAGEVDVQLLTALLYHPIQHTLIHYDDDDDDNGTHGAESSEARCDHRMMLFFNNTKEIAVLRCTKQDVEGGLNAASDRARKYINAKTTFWLMPHPVCNKNRCEICSAARKLTTEPELPPYIYVVCFRK